MRPVTEAASWKPIRERAIEWNHIAGLPRAVGLCPGSGWVLVRAAANGRWEAASIAAAYCLPRPGSALWASASCRNLGLKI